jgi:hypothetical protein
MKIRVKRANNLRLKMISLKKVLFYKKICIFAFCFYGVNYALWVNTVK